MGCLNLLLQFYMSSLMLMYHWDGLPRQVPQNYYKFLGIPVIPAQNHSQLIRCEMSILNHHLCINWMPVTSRNPGIGHGSEIERLKRHPKDSRWAGGLAGSFSRSAWAKIGKLPGWKPWKLGNWGWVPVILIDNLVALVCSGCSRK